MPIAIDNGLPHIAFDLLGTTTFGPTLCGLMDTCSALNTGYLPFHQWLMSEYPVVVADCITFKETNPFEPVKLGGVISNPDNFDGSTHGNLTAVIQYFTPYTNQSGNPITFSFALARSQCYRQYYFWPPYALCLQLHYFAQLKLSSQYHP
jgi:hypothetical protein